MPIDTIKFIKISTKKFADSKPNFKYFDQKKASAFKGFSLAERLKVCHLIAKNFENYMLNNLYQPHVVINLLTLENPDFKDLIHHKQHIKLHKKNYIVTSIFLHDSMNDGQYILGQYANRATALYNNFCNNVYI